MSFIIDSAVNNGYPYIEGLSEIASIIPVKPYFKYISIADSKRNNGYPTFESFEDIQTVTMQKLYPHGLMICMGDNLNSGYPCIPEINNVTVKKSSDIFFSCNRVTDMYYKQKYIASAYCNEKKVFSIEYIAR